jgi:CrcB protein
MSGPGLWAGVALLGGLGALARYLVDVLVGLRLGGRLPLGTLAVNVSGSLALGALSGAAVAHGVSLAAGAGFLGAYTTFSTYMAQIYRSTSTGHLAIALTNAFGSLAAGVLAVYGGILVARAV